MANLIKGLEVRSSSLDLINGSQIQFNASREINAQIFLSENDGYHSIIIRVFVTNKYWRDSLNQTAQSLQSELDNFKGSSVGYVYVITIFDYSDSEISAKSSNELSTDENDASIINIIRIQQTDRTIHNIDNKKRILPLTDNTASEIILSSIESFDRSKLAHETAVTPNYNKLIYDYSDVSMRLFKEYTLGDEITALVDFFVTRGDWSYIADSDYIASINAMGISFQGSMSSSTFIADHALKDEFGEPILDQFNVAGRYISDPDNQAYRDWYVAELLNWESIGATSIQRDEPTAIGNHTIQQADNFFIYTHAQFYAQKTGDITLSANLAWNGSVFGGAGQPVTQHFDFGMAEFGTNDVYPLFFKLGADESKNQGKQLIYTSFNDLGIPDYRRSIAACYANGLLFIVPWDQWAGLGNPRVFAEPSDLADLYGFVRANKIYLDNYEEFAFAGWGMVDTRYQYRKPIIVDDTDICVMAKSIPSNESAPMVIHLIDWNDQYSSFSIKVSTSIFKWKSIKVSLRSPSNYDANVHQLAQSSGDYASLSSNIDLNFSIVDDYVIIPVTKIKQWMILVISTN